MKSDAKKRSPEASNLDGVAQALVMAAVSIPILFNPWGANAFELPKALAIRTVAILLGMVTLANAAEKGHLGGKRLPLHVIALILLTVALIAATLFSLNPRLSLWGSYNRQQGLVTLTSYAILFLSTAYVLGNRAHIDRLWTLLVMGSVPVVTYGLLQACSLDPLEWQTDAASPVLSTLGRANFLGSYLTLIIPLTFGRVLLGRHRLPLVLLLAGQGICLLLTQARGAWVGSGAGFIAGLLAWGYGKRDHRPFVAAVVTTVLVISFLVVLNLPGGPLAPLASLPCLNRLATLFQTRAGSTAARIAIWRTALPLIAHHPWLGYGPETLRLVFAPVFPPQLVYYQGRGVIVDRAHNLWLDLAVNAGLPAVSALLLLIFALGKRIRRGLRNTTDPWQTVVWTALVASLTGHLVELQFGFETVSTATVLALLMAMSVALSRTTSLERANAALVSTKEVIRYIPPFLVTLILVVLVVLRPLLADIAHRRSTLDTRALTTRVRDSEQAVGLWQLEPTYHLHLAHLYALQGTPKKAIHQMETARHLSPQDPEARAVQGAIYVELGQLQQAEAAYRHAVELAPDVARYHQALGLTLARQGRLEEAVAELERTVALDATDVIAYQWLADLHATLGNKARAEEARQLAEYWEQKLAEEQDSLERR